MSEEFEPGDNYRTRDGRPARVYATDGTKECKIHGAVFDKKYGWSQYNWYEDGSWIKDEEDNNDLIKVPPRIKVDLWVNVYDGHTTSQQSEINAIHHAGALVRARKKITIDCEVGEGL